MKRRSFWFVLVLPIAGFAFLALHLHQEPARAAPPTGAAPADVPVTSAVVQKQDIPIILDGLGTVQAFSTVTIKARVDGQLDKLGFTEGQDVKEGDVIAQIDPRPFRAQLAQAQAAKVRDEALLRNAHLDLE